MSEVAVTGVLFVYLMAVTGFSGYVLLAAKHLVLSCSDHCRICLAVTGVTVCSSGCLAASSELQWSVQMLCSCDWYHSMVFFLLLSSQFWAAQFIWTVVSLWLVLLCTLHCLVHGIDKYWLLECFESNEWCLPQTNCRLRNNEIEGNCIFFLP